MSMCISTTRGVIVFRKETRNICTRESVKRSNKTPVLTCASYLSNVVDSISLSSPEDKLV